MAGEPLTYGASGVDMEGEEGALSRLLFWVKKTFSLSPTAKPCLPLGYFANVLSIEGLPLGIALTADGVGSKLLVAEMAGCYRTVGIDLVAMNANDLLCVGAKPLALVDYVAVESLRPEVLAEVGEGLFRGAEQARMSIVGGELAQLGEMVRGVGEGGGLDLAGAAIGTVPLERILVGQSIEGGDVLVGLASSGIHSNGLTLARRVFFRERGFKPESYLPELGRTVGEELLEPTRIYVPEVLEMLERGLRLKALLHITGGGFLNLLRTQSPVGYMIHTLPDPPPIFALLQSLGGIEDAEMFRVYNMGVGFCVVVAKEDVRGVLEIARRWGTPAWEMGFALPDPERTLILEPRHLRSRGKHFTKV